MGTPSSASAALAASIIGGGPHRWTRRLAISGTERAMNSFEMGPVAPIQAVPSARDIVAATCKFACRFCRYSSSSRKTNSSGLRAP